MRNNNYRDKEQFRSVDLLSTKSIDEPLSVFYKDGAKIYLPKTGYAYQFAQEFGMKNRRGRNDSKEVSSSQIRKILNEIKACGASLKEENFYEVRNRLFAIVPMTAYNAARNKILVLYDFVYNHINEKTIQSAEDIKVLDSLFTSIVAYRTANEEKGK